MISPLSRRVSISLRGRELSISGPLLVPAFSSKALEITDLAKVYKISEEYITESFLVSAYDIRNGFIEPPTSAFAELMFLDSGGYEASQDTDIMEPFYPKPPPGDWALRDYEDVLSGWDHLMPTFATSYDHPNQRQNIIDQINSAKSLFASFPEFGREFLVKPETTTQEFLPIPRVIDCVGEFSNFDIIGCTEKELGNSPLSRMVNITRIRRAMEKEGITRPIHVFGSLDPVTTPLYYLAGADIFDGLSWLRFSFFQGLLVHHDDRGSLEYGVTSLDRQMVARGYVANLSYLADLRNQMETYLLNGDFDHFRYHQVFLKESFDQWLVKVGGV